MRITIIDDEPIKWDNMFRVYKRLENSMESTKKKAEMLVILIMIITSLFMILNFFQREHSYQRFENGTIHYVKAVVVDVLEQDLSWTDVGDKYLTGYQKVHVHLADGKEIVVDHYVTLTHNIIVSKGNKVIVLEDSPEGIEPYYSIYNYDRSTSAYLISAAFILVLFIVGKTKGLRSGLGLAFSMTTIVCYMMPKLYDGEQAGFAIFSAIVLSAAGSCFCIGGFEKKTICNIINTSLGGILAGIIYYVLILLMKIQGGTLDSAEELLLISQATGMKLKSIMFAGIMIAVLGAVMDVAVSMGAALWEIKERNDHIGKMELFHAGMNIGKDMIGTMTNTLILAFLGGTLPSLLVFMSYGVQYHQFISSDFLALELVQGIAGSTAVILTVPISAAICSYIYCEKGRKVKYDV